MQSIDIIRNSEGLETPYPIAKGTGIIQYETKRKNSMMWDPNEATFKVFESGKSLSLVTQQKPYEP